MKKKKKISTNNLTCGLFNSRNIISNLRDVPIYFKRVGFTLKHGYSPMAKWETSHWFICVMREIFTHYRYKRLGDIPFDDVPEEKWTEKNNEFYDTMLSLLDDMDEEKYYPAGTTRGHMKMEVAKEEFFELFTKYFYDLWD